MSSDVVTSDSWRPQKPFVTFGIVVVVLLVLRIILGFVVAPPAVALGLSLLNTVIFVGLPIYGLFYAAAHSWTAKQAWVPLLVGVVLHAGMFLIIRSLKLEGAPQVFASAFMQTGVMFWCLGLGALVSILIREKNMILPIAIFLAGMDAFLILTPFTPQAKIVKDNPEIVGALGVAVPGVKAAPAAGETVPVGTFDLAYIGPADLFIAAMLFACIFRYGMQTRATAKWLGPVLVGYMLLVLGFRISLPALVPIGLTVLLVNRKEFTMNKEERQATWGVTVIALAMAGFGVYNSLTYKPPKQPDEPAMQTDGSGEQKPPSLPGSTDPDPNR